MKAQIGRNYNPIRSRTIGYKYQRGNNIFKRFAPQLKSIGKKIGKSALNAGLDFVKQVVIEKKKPKDAIKSATMNEINKFVNRKKTIKSKNSSHSRIRKKGQKGSGRKNKGLKKKRKFNKGFQKIKL